MSGRSKKTSSRLHQPHHEAPKWTKIAFCSVVARAFAWPSTCSAVDGSPNTASVVRYDTAKQNTIFITMPSNLNLGFRSSLPGLRIKPLRKTEGGPNEWLKASQTFEGMQWLQDELETC